MKSTPTTRPGVGLLVAGAMAAAALCVPAPALAQPVPSATYTGTINGGGTVDFDVSADGKVITRFKASDLPCTLGGPASSVTVELPTPNVPIINNAFTKSGAFGFSGSFTGPQQAQGTVSNSDSQCATGEHNWTASTTTLPPPPPVFKFGPTSGGTKTNFTVQFTAGLNEHGTTDFYVVNISGPQGCRDVRAFTTEDATAGQRVTLRVDPSDIKPFGKARQWCVGRYSGSVYFCYCGPNDPRPNVPVGSFGFAVRGPANYSGNTSQGKSIRFTLSATGTRITPPRTDIRFTCRYPGAPSRKFTLPLRPQSHGTIPFGNGTFRVSESFNPQGARDNLDITGRLAGGTFQGKMRYHGSGHGVSCDSGSVAWSAR